MAALSADKVARLAADADVLSVKVSACKPLLLLHTLIALKPLSASRKNTSGRLTLPRRRSSPPSKISTSQRQRTAHRSRQTSSDIQHVLTSQKKNYHKGVQHRACSRATATNCATRTHVPERITTTSRLSVHDHCPGQAALTQPKNAQKCAARRRNGEKINRKEERERVRSERKRRGGGLRERRGARQIWGAPLPPPSSSFLPFQVPSPLPPEIGRGIRSSCKSW